MHYSHALADRRSVQLAITPLPSDVGSAEPRSHYDHQAGLYLDFLLENRHAQGMGGITNESSVVKVRVERSPNRNGKANESSTAGS
jgi:hypothetical protein